MIEGLSRNLSFTISLDKYDSDGDNIPDKDCIWDLSKNHDNSVRAYLYDNGFANNMKTVLSKKLEEIATTSVYKNYLF